MIQRVKDLLFRAKTRVADLTHGVAAARSPHWPAVRRKWLTQHPACACCGTTKSVQVHHRRPFHLFPELELADGSGQFGTPVGVCNFITLCEQPGVNHHLGTGHDGDWKKYNPDVERIAALMLASRAPVAALHR